MHCCSSSLFVTVAHQLSHNHLDGEPCEVCVLSHAHSLLGDAATLTPIDHYYEKFSFKDTSYPVSSSILTHNRLPPLYAGAKNLFDTLQTNTESPLFYDATGGFDSAHIWGPLRGRMVYAGIKAAF